MDVPSILEAILFVAEAPVPIEELAEVLEIPVVDVRTELDVLADRLAGRGLELRSVGGGWRLYTGPDAYPFLDRFASTATATRLSQAALETLAIVAYRQPVSRSQVAEVRGVDADSALRTLERRGLIAETGRLSLPGNPAVYGTTDLFLEKMGLQSLGGLPPLADHIPAATVVESLEETFKP
ncbi:MAG: SMC-Scp complex subunit ScpB [Acidimicrobiia bacterium]|nr:SMC-Scp complex subunit ScpB [Acidimicrobiia bacterium]